MPWHPPSGRTRALLRIHASSERGGILGPSTGNLIDDLTHGTLSAPCEALIEAPAARIPLPAAACPPPFFVEGSLHGRRVAGKGRFRHTARTGN